MNSQIELIEQKVQDIETRNKRVETDKAWETSKTRVISICIITYLIALSFMSVMNTKNVFLGALVPAIGFYLSTQSLPVIKKMWINRIAKEGKGNLISLLF